MLGEVPALVVDDAVTVVIATLHHQRCRPSAWVDRGAIAVARSSSVSVACLSLVLQANAGGGEGRAALLVNPRLETLLIERSPSGRWQVNLGTESGGAGLLTSIASLLDVSKPIPGAIAQLRGGEIVVSLAGSPPREYAAGADTQLRGGEIVVSLRGFVTAGVRRRRECAVRGSPKRAPRPGVVHHAHSQPARAD